MIAKLDKRLVKSSKKSDKNSSIFGEKLVNKIIDSSPPAETPKWAVDVGFQIQPQLLETDVNMYSVTGLRSEIEITDSSSVNPSKSLAE